MRSGSAFRRLVKKIKFAMQDNPDEKWWGWLARGESSYPKNWAKALKQAHKELKSPLGPITEEEK